mgnify:CR=1 FL=1
MHIYKKMMEEEMDNVLILVDEDNNEHPFEVIDMVEVDGSQYAVLAPLEEGSEEDEAIILKIVTDENGEEMLVSIDDDDEFDFGEWAERGFHGPWSDRT